jgi:hypothetical protein
MVAPLWVVLGIAPQLTVAEAAGPVPQQTVGECPSDHATPGPGIVDPFHVPLAAAKQLNADALILYRQGRWEEARKGYLAAAAADPDFLAPALNIACSYVRQERFADAVAALEKLLDRAFLPWSDEVETAADLGALKVLPEGKRLRQLLDQDRRRWAEGLGADLLFVARTRAPLKVGMTERHPGGTFVLGPRQEVFAWSPRTRRYRQLTAEQGRVLALGRSRDGRRIAYATAEKLIFADEDASSKLRGLVIKEVDLSTLSLLAEARAPGDVKRLEILRAGSGFAYRIDSPAGKGEAFAIRDGALAPAALPRTATIASVLTGQGAVSGNGSASLAPNCAAVAKEVRAPDGAPAVQVRPGDTNGVRASLAKGKALPFIISGPFGGGLAGLTFQ